MTNLWMTTRYSEKCCYLHNTSRIDAYNIFIFYRTTTLKDDPHFRKITCLSCDVAEDCQYVEATFSSTGKYYILSCKGPGVPSYHLYSTDVGFCKYCYLKACLVVF